MEPNDGSRSAPRWDSTPSIGAVRMRAVSLNPARIQASPASWVVSMTMSILARVVGGLDDLAQPLLGRLALDARARTPSADNPRFSVRRGGSGRPGSGVPRSARRRREPPPWRGPGPRSRRRRPPCGDRDRRPATRRVGPDGARGTSPPSTRRAREARQLLLHLVVREHGKRIEVDRRPGEGGRVLGLPRREAQRDELLRAARRRRVRGWGSPRAAVPRRRSAR